MSATCVSSVNPWTVHAVRIVAILEEIPGVQTYELAFEDESIAEQFHFQPGQFNMLYLPGSGEAAISLSAHPSSQKSWAHTIRTVGNVTTSLARLGVGGKFGLRGPFGSAWPIQQYLGKHVIFMAGGIGLAPLRPAVYWALDHADQFASLRLIYGARSPELVLYENEFAAWRERGMQIAVTVDRADEHWQGNVGVAPLLLDRLTLEDRAATAVLCCGPDVMMQYSAKSAVQKGISRENIWLSLERNMQCAIGLCGHCQYGPEFVCRNGPVFRLDRVEPFLRVEGI